MSSLTKSMGKSQMGRLKPFCMEAGDFGSGKGARSLQDVGSAKHYDGVTPDVPPRSRHKIRFWGSSVNVSSINANAVQPEPTTI